MKTERNTKRYTELSHGQVVYFYGAELRVYKPGWPLDLARPDIHVAVVNSLTGKVSHIHFGDLQVEAEEVPEPKTSEYDGTDYYQETKTGALYKRQRSDDRCHDYFICLGSMKPSVTALPGDVPVGFKRLYKEA